MKVFLVGYMGSGKSTVGRKIATRLQHEFADLDAYIESKTGKTIPEIFSQQGEEIFREIEHDAMLDLIKWPKYIISTGGGTPCFFDNMDLMKQNGITIYLKLTSSQLFQRLHRHPETRPLLTGKSDAELKEYIEKNLAIRESYYNQAHYIMDGFTPDVDMIARVLLNY
jgi:shikimate kinase